MFPVFYPENTIWSRFGHELSLRRHVFNTNRTAKNHEKKFFMHFRYRYFCNKCGKEHEIFEDAVWCCTVVGAFLCERCDQRHDNSADAEKCCRKHNLTGVNPRRMKNHAENSQD